MLICSLWRLTHFLAWKLRDDYNFMKIYHYTYWNIPKNCLAASQKCFKEGMPKHLSRKSVSDMEETARKKLIAPVYFFQFTNEDL